MLQGEKSTTSFGRDHQRASFTIWMASGGIKRAFSLGTTDDLGVEALTFRTPLWEVQTGDTTLPDRLTWTFSHRKKNPIVVGIGPFPGRGNNCLGVSGPVPVEIKGKQQF